MANKEKQPVEPINLPMATIVGLGLFFGGLLLEPYVAPKGDLHGLLGFGLVVAELVVLSWRYVKRIPVMKIAVWILIGALYWWISNVVKGNGHPNIYYAMNAIVALTIGGYIALRIYRAWRRRSPTPRSHDN